MAAERKHIDLDELARLYHDGRTNGELRAHFGIGPRALNDRLTTLGLATDRRRRLTAEQEMTAVEMYLGGATKNDVARHFGIASGSAGNILERNGIAKSNRNEAVRIRNARMTPEQRLANTKAAHDAVRGRKVGYDELCQRAVTRERTGGIASSVAEHQLAALLRERTNLPVIQQKAVGKYNIDIAIGSVAVEVSGRNLKGYSLTISRERTEYIIDSGYLFVRVWANRSRNVVTADLADYLVALAEQVSGDPSARREYRVVRGNGQLVASGSREDDHFAGVDALVSPRCGRTAD